VEALGRFRIESGSLRNERPTIAIIIGLVTPVLVWAIPNKKVV
jgi:hypothetical protein